MSGHLYIASEGPRGPIKIGISRDPCNRMGSLQTGNARLLRFAAIFPMHGDQAREAEAILHEELEDFALVGEWFALSEKFIAEYMPDFFRANGIELAR